MLFFFPCGILWLLFPSLLPSTVFLSLFYVKKFAKQILLPQILLFLLQSEKLELSRESTTTPVLRKRYGSSVDRLGLSASYTAPHTFPENHFTVWGSVPSKPGWRAPSPLLGLFWGSECTGIQLMIVNVRSQFLDWEVMRTGWYFLPPVRKAFFTDKILSFNNTSTPWGQNGGEFTHFNRRNLREWKGLLTVAWLLQLRAET